jgi:SAM-dependent methyltransferase
LLRKLSTLGGEYRVSSDNRPILARIPHGTGLALDLGGGRGTLRGSLEARDYRYVNLDSRQELDGGSICGDAHCLPFVSKIFDLVVSKDSLEHLSDPDLALREVGRVLKPEGRLVVWVPFLHPFHGDDLFRYTPIGLRQVLGRCGLEILSLDAPLRAFSVVGQLGVALVRRFGFGSFESGIERVAYWLDRRLARARGSGMSLAAAYLVVARRS